MRAIVTATASTLLLAAAFSIPAGAAQPLPGLATASAVTEKVSYRRGWNRHCWRECRIGRHGRLYCTWHCYRPRRWW